MTKVDVETTGERIAFQKFMGDIWRRLEILEVNGDDAAQTSIRLEYFRESDKEVLDVQEFSLPEWAEPLDKWRGESKRDRAVSFVDYRNEVHMWLIYIRMSDRIVDLATIEGVLLGEIEFKKSIEDWWLMECGLDGRWLTAASAAIALISIPVMPDLNDYGVEILKRVLFDISMTIRWRVERRRGKTGRPRHENADLVAMYDVLLRKHSVMKKKERYDVIRDQVGLFCEDGTIDKTLRRNAVYTEIFKGGLAEWMANRDAEVRREIKHVVERIRWKLLYKSWEADIAMLADEDEGV